jgi:hypothetical protein
VCFVFRNVFRNDRQICFAFTKGREMYFVYFSGKGVKCFYAFSGKAMKCVLCFFREMFFMRFPERP